MSTAAVSTGLSITNPLVLYRSLLTTNRLNPDPAQHRLALYLQELYFRLKDYNPEIEYRQRLEQAAQSLPKAQRNGTQQGSPPPPRSIWSLLRSTSPSSTLSLTRSIPLHESARQIQSPKGLLLHGEVGRGKSMLLDLIYQSLPSAKKRRYHFTTFMLDIFRRIERERISRLALSPGLEMEHVVLSLARESIAVHPILFLDEFQLPDRASSKLLSLFMTSFFHLGGVLVASSNRMPEELAKAQGVEFGVRPAKRFDWKTGYSRWTIRSPQGEIAARNDFAEFLDVLKARCDVWQMEGDRDWRREVEAADLEEDGTNNDDAAAVGSSTTTSVRTQRERISTDAPSYYHVSLDTQRPTSFNEAVIKLNPTESWTQTDLTVYGRVLKIASTFTPSASIGQIHTYSFQALCGANLGPADYISIASTAHTIIIHSIPVLTSNLKNEARRLITLLDALYEARCRLLISAAAPPDSLFFPELQTRYVSTNGTNAGLDNKSIPTTDIPSPSTAPDSSTSDDSVYQESFSEIYQESTAPFRPNVSSYQLSSSSTTRRPLSIDEEDTSARPTPSLHNPTLRSILADEDSDFGPTYGNGRSSGISTGQDSQSRFAAPDFTQTSALTGSDERFAYRRARSRLWEMCGRKWWDARSDEDVASWWTPVVSGERPWEGLG